MLSFLAKQVLKRYRPAVVAVLSANSDFNPSPAIAAALSGQFIVSAPKAKIRTAGEAVSGIFNMAGKSRLEQVLMALSSFIEKKPKWPEIVILDIEEKFLENLEELAEFLKFDFIIALPNTDKNLFLPDNIKKFTKGSTRLVVKSSDRNSVPAALKKNLKILTYSSPASDIFSSDMVLQSNGGIKGVVRFGVSFKINHKGTVLPVRISRTVNEREVCNILIAALVGLEVGLNLVEIASAFEKYAPSGGMAVIEGIKRSVIIDGSSDSGCESAFKALKSLPRLKSGRKLILLGDILGLGFEAEAEHRRIAKCIFSLKPDMVFLVGNRIGYVLEELRGARFPAERIFKFDDAEEVEKVLQPRIREDDLILVVGSKKMGLKKIIEQIMANPPVK